MAQLPPAAKLENLPPPWKRTTRGGPRLAGFDRSMRVLTPTLGGAARLRTIDEIDVIRAPGVRGSLRSWWRAMRGHEFETPKERYEAEGALRGRAADEQGGRSEVETPIKLTRTAAIDDDATVLHDPGSSALRPAGKQKADTLSS